MGFFEREDIVNNLFNSAALTLGILLLRYAVVRAIGRAKTLAPELRRHWTVQVKNISIAIIVIGLFGVWASELRSFALSLVAIAAALVIATKELILCLLGGTLRTVSRPFKIGDRIEVGVYRGDVITHDLLTTTLLEVGPGHQAHQYTGRGITLPNSLFLSTPILNETRSGPYVLHTFTVPLTSVMDVQAHKECLLNIAQETTAPYLTDAKNHMKRLGEREGINTPSVEPRVTFSMPTPERIDLLVRVPVPTPRSGRIEQAILCEYLKRRPQTPYPAATGEPAPIGTMPGGPVAPHSPS